MEISKVRRDGTARVVRLTQSKTARRLGVVIGAVSMFIFFRELLPIRGTGWVIDWVIVPLGFLICAWSVLTAVYGLLHRGITIRKDDASERITVETTRWLIHVSRESIPALGAFVSINFVPAANNDEVPRWSVYLSALQGDAIPIWHETREDQVSTFATDLSRALELPLGRATEGVAGYLMSAKGMDEWQRVEGMEGQRSGDAAGLYDDPSRYL